jgi:threonine synthase
MGLSSGTVGSANVNSTISSFWPELVLDPHTAVGVTVALSRTDDNSKKICMGCAHPIKFVDTIQRASGLNGELAVLEVFEHKYHDQPNVLHLIKLAKIAFGDDKAERAKYKAPYTFRREDAHQWHIELKSIIDKIALK